MNFIQIARETRKRSGMQGTGPSSVSATGYESAIVAYVQDAWEDIQREREWWRWMRSEIMFLTTAGKKEYTLEEIFGPSYRFNRWHKDTLYIKVDDKWSKLYFLEYDNFIASTQNQVNETKPFRYTIRPEDSAIVIESPAEVYTLKVDYQKSIQELENDSDVPEMPSQFHKLIVYGATMKYAEELGRQGKFNSYSVNYTRLLYVLMRNQLPKEYLKMRPIV